MKYIIPLFITFQMFSQEIDYSQFDKGIPIKVNYLKEIYDQVMYTYKDSLFTNAKSDDDFRSILNALGVDRDKVQPIFRYIFYSSNKQYSIFKYKTAGNELETKTMTKLLVFEKGVFSVVDTPTKNVKLLYEIFKMINLDFYKAIKSESNNSKYSEINKLKSLLKDNNQIIDTKKLLEIINTNRESLDKYLDDSL
ncbi:hypothetical protein IWQ47_002132 [Aquimarina sp. EL_43]|uniref:hypothetical protein n=1 Tax=unclassified Aquimarina TaxID=2627091 RepID=UPI0018CA297C|nr:MULTISPECIES: hypothetical protein [unclassified Aquimarina]MBG6130656.1 hypothetical protein [Aquimarina sp. EL_35]MBG6151198.1 hypothetical protein [Aquimarina sp. EL_32]MBG6169058.1 hypothetical protein [Aquimarina sp. EL_43]